jgi:hypothetical protein
MKKKSASLIIGIAALGGKKHLNFGRTIFLSFHLTYL